MTVSALSPAGPDKLVSILDRWASVRRFVLPLLLMVVVLAGWEYVARTGLVSKLVLAPPTSILAALFHERASLLSNSGVTLTQAIIGFVIGNSLGLLAAIVFLHYDIVRRALFPLAIGAEAIPVVVVVPVLILWLGNGMAPKIFIAAFLSFFPMLINAYRGLRSADAEVSELLYTLGASRLQNLMLVRLPASLPFLFNALKLSACGAVVASLVAEWLASNQGLGHLIILYGQSYMVAEVWAAALVASMASIGLYWVVAMVEHITTPWIRMRRADL